MADVGFQANRRAEDKNRERSPWQFSLANILTVVTLLTVVLSIGRAMLLSDVGSNVDARFESRMEVVLALPLIGLALALAILGRLHQPRPYYALMGVAALAASGMVLFQLSAAPFRPDVVPTYAFFAISAGAYLVIMRQCGARLTWRGRSRRSAESMPGRVAQLITRRGRPKSRLSPTTLLHRQPPSAHAEALAESQARTRVVPRLVHAACST